MYRLTPEGLARRRTKESRAEGESGQRCEGYVRTRTSVGTPGSRRRDLNSWFGKGGRHGDDGRRVPNHVRGGGDPSEETNR